jgi:hypothetical protein
MLRINSLRKLLAVPFALTLGAGAFATNAPDWVVGSYRLELSQEVKGTAQKLGMPEPYARILLRQDGTFSYASNNGGNVTGTSGTYDLSDHTIRLVANDEFPAQHVKSLSGKAGDGSIELDGLRYVKAGASLDVVGTWNVRSGLQVDRSIKMTFKQDHTFEFAGMSASSKGRYDIEGDKLTLTWTEVDGEAVEAGSMHKTIYLRDDCFFIDTYRYVRN